jgi:hypothetical protein
MTLPIEQVPIGDIDTLLIAGAEKEGLLNAVKD